MDNLSVGRTIQLNSASPISATVACKDGRYYSRAHQHYSYLARGVYVDQLMVWRRYFDERQMLVLESEALFRDPASVLHEVQEFLGLPIWQIGTYDQRNTGGHSPMEADVREQLQEYFGPHNKRLTQYLGRTFGWAQ